jgi:hypothetical protein
MLGLRLRQKVWLHGLDNKRHDGCDLMTRDHAGTWRFINDEIIAICRWSKCLL